ncbi:chitobiosyldiphosphodolichol beta-mannosyltransferase-like isoform X2 [Teleopsis dalmanni]|uniref:chitobiosyldiphosphodolichol beta-mannosyltransferase-like isoform X2 n=1 Tax=Teleopsis dalmanni TaxID=139649 RepID=UPI0018CCCD9E|nr:chitobiosyldiphosphodolichol beta-mannosyltransferase-like isoform X2 [Teleopsis dalmanni]XP_037951123.1 chitobiosyldiphosphodolichol beta-mannosyltransferase-like isoform X2 [Teleopsis dalmanni]
MASTQCRGNAAVVVLGDIGRSPRMEYHCLSLLEENFNVDVIGYVETNPLYAIRRGYPKCKIHELSPVPITNLIPILKLFFKAIWQTISLLIALMSIRRPDFLLVQNPPCVPALLVCYIYSAVTRSKLVIDWHNYTYTILGLSAGEKSFLCGIAKRIERFCGQKANANICVTKAMKCDLQKNWNIRDITVLYDRPSARFHSIDLCRKHEIFMKLSKDYPQFLPKCYSDLKECGVIESTAFTQKQVNGKVVYKKQRMAILISSTSWTPDEDFSILIKALKVKRRINK